MRIWLITENWPPRVGGIERYLTGIASHLEGHDVTVIAPFDSPADSGIAQGKPLEVRVLRKRFFWPMWPKWLPLYFSLEKLALREQPDLVICGKALVEGRIALLHKKRLGIPYIICTYGMEIATWSSIPRVKKQLEKVLHHAGAVLYINDKTKEELLSLGTPTEKLQALYPGLDASALTQMSNPDETLKKFNISKPYIITVARMVKRKGIDDLIQAFANVQTEDLQLVIVGDGPERNVLEEQAKKLRANSVFVGQISDEDLHALYSTATIFALTPKELPGDYEGFGIVYTEAAFFGLPTIGTKTGGVSGAVLDAKTGILVDPGNVESIAGALRKLMADPILAKQYGEAGKERAIQEFSWKKIIQKLETIITTL